MSSTMTVPAAVPSVFHSSLPFVASLALKKTVLPTASKPYGLLSPPPGMMFLSITVPPTVPSDTQGSNPSVPFVARKKSLPLASAKAPGVPPIAPDRRSLKRFASASPVAACAGAADAASPSAAVAAAALRRRYRRSLWRLDIPGCSLR
jgi:hypothetical protein